MDRGIIIGTIFVGLVAIIAAGFSINSISGLKNQLNEKFFGTLKRIQGLESEQKSTGSPVGYVIKFENGTTFYISGDSGITAEMEIIKDFYDPDVAFLTIGGGYTMGEEEAAYAATLVNPSGFIIPYHYNSYPMLGASHDTFVKKVRAYKASGKLQADPLTFENDEEKNVLGVKVRWLGHGTFLFTSPGGKRILLDPSEASPAWPERYRDDIAQLGEIDLIIITHAHFDHFYIPTLRKIIAANPGVPVLVQFELSFYTAMRLETNVIGANMDSTLTKETLKLLSGVDVNIGSIEMHLVPANHSSSIFSFELPPEIEIPIFQ